MTTVRWSWCAVPALNALFQVLIKQGAEELNDAPTALAWLASGLSSRWVLGAIAVEIVCFFLWMDVLGQLDLSRAFPLSGISYLLIVASGWLVFGEPVSALQIAGGGLILCGVWLVAGAGRKSESPNRQASGEAETGKDCRC
ncbi:EamA family transporter [Rhizobium sp. RAF56]|uniref:EamA family transporter n=1 Tax=Rhizobium sp. RAF56 TaxID=3233062 RepID=UPI003F9E0FA8